jgi:poly(A) polymerase
MRRAAEKVVRHLQEAGHQALFAGGCVRDMLMGKRPHDYDVATSAKPKEVTALFRRTRKVGAKFGVVLVRLGPFDVEVATFRTDLDYEDGRHPTRVQFTNAKEDALRRDFTINGMFYDPIARETVDYVGGQQDLKLRVIRAIGEPDRRFAEDHLRMLRAIRFAARFGFTIDAATWDAIRRQAASIQRISPERVREELAQMLVHPTRARAFADIQTAGLLPHLWAGAEQIIPDTRRIHAILKFLPTPASFELTVAAVLHGLSTADVESACDALRCSNQSKRTIIWLVAHQDDLTRPADVSPADLKLLMAYPAFGDLLRLFSSKLRASRRPLTPYRQVVARVRAIPAGEVAPPPLLNGDDLATLGLERGPRYKEILHAVYRAQLDGTIRNREAALALAACLVGE